MDGMVGCFAGLSLLDSFRCCIRDSTHVRTECA